MGTFWPKSQSYEFDSDAQPAPGAKAYFYDAGTTTPRPVYQDAALGTPHTHPVLADGNGRWPNVFLQFGSYRQTITTAGNETLASADNIPNPAPFDSSTTVDPNSLWKTGYFLFSGPNASVTAFVRCNGRTIGSATSGATERANNDTEALFTFVWNGYAQAQCAVVGGRGATAAADYAANKQIALPNFQSCAVIGFDDMGAPAGNFLAGVPAVNGSPIIAGSILGETLHTLAIGEIPAHSFTVTGSTSTAGNHAHGFSGTTSTDPGHSHTGVTGTNSVGHTHNFLYSISQTGQFSGPGSNGWAGQTNANTGGESAPHVHGFTTDGGGAHAHTYSGTTATVGDHAHTVTGTTNSLGGGASHNNVQRSMPVTVLMKL